MTRKPLSATETAIFEILVEAANVGAKCPSNTRIADRLGHSATNISNVMGTIARKGWIDIDTRTNGRIVTILSTGKVTAPLPTPRKRIVNPVRTVPRVQAKRDADIAASAIRIEKRDPCFNCGVPYDRHTASTCKRWRGAM
ncbi:hypothetical protein [Caenibius sp. WL]|uniref:hypothetical protein n=1 Tax=Caenibius sp. WL TaxID=2872646 RepID=UPI001C99D4C6|nr:hypothetical protein [Caenibius sp. WL]QZP06814.1 hypothetical protein K5X80_08740 [Caenibius sp. WL]